MKGRFLLMALGISGFLSTIAFGRTRVAANQCLPEEKALIESEARCFENGGVDIGYNGSEGVKVACMQDRRVQGTCGPDGQLTRLHAYRQWYNQLKKFEASCMTKGGSFAFEDPTFTEPLNESFCLQAQPEVGTDMFESSLCNYRSLCPSVEVVCEFSCGRDKVTLEETGAVLAAQANLPGVPAR